MKLIARVPRGTQDILPADSYKYRYIIDGMKKISDLYGFAEISTPIFESTDLFLHSVGNDTDVVQKEMYTFEDKAGRSLTLRPEGTAGVARAVLENALYNNGYPIKLFYDDLCFRYEKPQNGRMREFHQFGVEVFGSEKPEAELEIISLALNIFKKFGIGDYISLQINSIGCPDCRKNYYSALREYFDKKSGDLCKICETRLLKNPMRILDCKNTKCISVANDAPNITDFLCDKCSEHFKYLQSLLDKAKIDYKLNPKIVRGLDYYTGSVFEFTCEYNYNELTVCGGGRYNNLLNTIGGMDIPALGFGIGLERLLMVIEHHNPKLLLEITRPQCDLFIATISDSFKSYAHGLCEKLRSQSYRAEFDIIGKSLGAQMKYADKINAKLSIVIGDQEILTKVATMKNMSTGESYRIRLDDYFVMDFKKVRNTLAN